MGWGAACQAGMQPVQVCVHLQEHTAQTPTLDLGHVTLEAHGAIRSTAPL